MAMNSKEIVKILRIRGESNIANKIAKAIKQYEKGLLTQNQLNTYARELWYKYDLPSK